MVSEKTTPLFLGFSKKNLFSVFFAENKPTGHMRAHSDFIV